MPKSMDVEQGDVFTAKIVVMAYANYWTAYCGPSDWSNQEIAGHGDKLSKRAAEELFLWRSMAASGRRYRE